MTEADATRRPLSMPAKFMAYLDNYRIYRLFKDIVADLIIALPRDHLKQMKIYLNIDTHSTNDTYRIMLLVSPDLDIDVKKLVKELIKDLGFFVITRRSILDKYENHDHYVPGCVDPVLMSLVTKKMTLRQPVLSAGWLMCNALATTLYKSRHVSVALSEMWKGLLRMLQLGSQSALLHDTIIVNPMADHPCTVREARCLQQDGVLPTTTLVLAPPPPQAPSAESVATPARSFFQQDFEGLKYAYKATLKEVHIEADDVSENIATKCFNAIHACAGGAQNAGQGYNVVGAPGVYRVLLIGPRGSGRKTHARILAKHFGMVYLDYESIFLQAKEKNDEIGKKLRTYGPSVQLKREIVERRLLEKDCLDHGWVMTGYPSSGMEFEHIDNMTTPPNRVIILNADFETCKQRALAVGVDWCTGKRAAIGSNPRVIPHPGETASQIDVELDYYLTEAMAEMRAAAGITAVEINVQQETIDDIQVKIQAAVMLAPAFDVVPCNKIRNVRAE